MKVRKIYCPYCGLNGGTMKYRGTEKIQLGQSSLIFPHAEHFFAGALTVSIYECNICHKLEFFRYRKLKNKETEKHGALS